MSKKILKHDSFFQNVPNNFGNQTDWYNLKKVNNKIV